MKGNNYFWVSLSDLMISLFFVMMVLFVITINVLKQREKVSKEILEEIENVQVALEGLDKDYFEFDEVNKRYRLRAEIDFLNGSNDILDIEIQERKKLLNAGRALHRKIESLIKKNDQIDYLIIIEGNAARWNNNFKRNPDMGYKLSYKRALALVNYWNSNGVNFRRLGKQCEVIIAGSGYFGYSRDENNENNNRKFTVQVTSKVGKLLDQVN